MVHGLPPDPHRSAHAITRRARGDLGFQHPVRQVCGRLAHGRLKAHDRRVQRRSLSSTPSESIGQPAPCGREGAVADRIQTRPAERKG